MKKSKRILLVGGASTDILAAAKQIARQPLFLPDSFVDDVTVSKFTDSIQIVVAEGFIDHREDTCRMDVKSRIQENLTKDYDQGFNGVAVVQRYNFNVKKFVPLHKSNQKKVLLKSVK